MQINSLEGISSVGTFINIAIAQNLFRITGHIFASLDACTFMELELNDERNKVSVDYNKIENEFDIL